MTSYFFTKGTTFSDRLLKVITIDGKILVPNIQFHQATEIHFVYFDKIPILQAELVTKARSKVPRSLSYVSVPANLAAIAEATLVPNAEVDPDVRLACRGGSWTAALD